MGLVTGVLNKDKNARVDMEVKNTQYCWGLPWNGLSLDLK
jgi:hypothetical protein